MIVTIQRQRLELLPEKAVIWKEKNTLLVADLHFGKAAIFQKKGIPIPEGSMQEDLKTLENLIVSHRVKECIVLGDLIHGKQGLTPTLIEEFSVWLKRVTCPVRLVIGNHDRGLVKRLPQNWHLEVHLETFEIAPFCFSHHPIANPATFVICGHIHPCFSIKSGFDELRLPCFKWNDREFILPAFSSFVGGYPVKKQGEDRIVVTTGRELIEI